MCASTALLWAVLAAAPSSGAQQPPEESGPDTASVTPDVVLPTLLQEAPARYPPELATQRIEGTVELELRIDESGDVEHATVAQGAHPLLDAAALHAAPRLRFSPALAGGAPVPVVLRFSYRFEAPAPPPAAPEIRAVSLRGWVRAKGSRRPLAGAILLSELAPSAPVETDVEGRFEAALPAGSQWIRVTAPGHKPASFREVLREGESLEVVYGLEPLVVNPYETVVRADRPRTELSRVTLHEQELREVPGTMGDPFRVVMLLPGVGSMLSGVAYPVVRGSQPASTGYFLDGIRVPILFHLFLGPAVVHPDFIDSIDFYPGAPPPEYGRLLGGAIDGKLTRPRDDRVHGSVYADLINAGLFIESPFETGTNVSLAGRVSYTPWIIALAATALQPPPPPGQKNPRIVLDFFDYQGRIEQELGGGRLRLFAFGSSDTFGSEARDDASTTSLQSVLFHRLDLRHRHPIGGGELEAGATWGLDRFEVVNRVPESGGAELRIDQTTAAARLSYQRPLGSGLSLRSGADIDHKRAELELVTVLPADGRSRAPVETRVQQPVATGTFTGGWAELLWEPRPWSIGPGIRVDHYQLLGGPGHWAIEPRLTLRREMTEALTLKGGFGLFHQSPTTLVSLPVLDLAGLRFGLQRGIQTSLGAEWRGFADWEVSLDIYFNPLVRSVELLPFGGEPSSRDEPVRGPAPGGAPPPGGEEPERPPVITDPIGEPDPNDTPLADELPLATATRGRAYGLELLIRHPLGDNWFGWLSYSLQRSTRFMRFSRYDDLGRTVGEAHGDLPFAFDQTHIVNLVLSRKLPGNVTLGGVFHFNTGRPETGGLTSWTQHEGTGMLGSPTWVPADRDWADRLPPFYRFDVRIAKSWAHETFSLDLYLDVLNVTLNEEVMAYEYSEAAGRLRKAPFGIPLTLPILGVKGQY